MNKEKLDTLQDLRNRMKAVVHSNPMTIKDLAGDIGMEVTALNNFWYGLRNTNFKNIMIIERYLDQKDRKEKTIKESV